MPSFWYAKQLERIPGPDILSACIAWIFHEKFRRIEQPGPQKAIRLFVGCAKHQLWNETNRNGAFLSADGPRQEICWTTTKTCSGCRLSSPAKTVLKWPIAHTGSWARVAPFIPGQVVFFAFLIDLQFNGKIMAATSEITTVLVRSSFRVWPGERSHFCPLVSGRQWPN